MANCSSVGDWYSWEQHITKSALEAADNSVHQVQVNPGQYTTNPYQWGGVSWGVTAKAPEPTRYDFATEMAEALKEGRQIQGPYRPGTMTCYLEGASETVYCVIDLRKHPGAKGRIRISDSARYRVQAERMNAKFLKRMTEPTA